MDKQLLRSIMALNGDTQKSLSVYLGITEQSLSAKMNNHLGKTFSKSEIESISRKYSLSADQLVSIFFTNLVP